MDTIEMNGERSRRALRRLEEEPSIENLSHDVDAEKAHLYYVDDHF
jgi:hypothetical protein